MKQRVITAFVRLPLIIFLLAKYYTVIFNVAMAVLYVLAVHEIRTTFKEGNSIAVFAMLDVVGLYFLFSEVLPKINPFLAAIAVFCVYSTVTVVRFEHIDVRNISTSILFGLYVLFGFYSLIGIKKVLPFEEYGYDGLFLIVMCVVVAWGADIFAYFTGYFFGKHKMAPVLSPKKTVEGAVGGIVITTVLVVLFVIGYARLKPVIEGNPGEVFILKGESIAVAAVAGLVGTLVEIVGDLFASAIKRQTGIKDYSNLFPGHGGVLDRFDSIIMLAPYILIVAMLAAKAGGMFLV